MFERWMVVSDLDGTLLNHDTYDFEVALARLKELQQSNVPVIFNTSKTFDELNYFTNQINHPHPFISENGSAIYIPQGYFSAQKEADEYQEVKLSPDFEKIKSFIQQQQPDAIDFSQCSVETAMKITGLKRSDALMAQNRRYTVPLMFEDSDKEKVFSELAQAHGLSTLKGGRFLHIQGNVNKGQALVALRNLYHQKHHVEYGVIALGDSQNDAAMLQQADISVVVHSPSSKKIQLNNRELVIHTQHGAPEGWVEGVDAAFAKIAMINNKFKHLQEKQHGR